MNWAVRQRNFDLQSVVRFVVKCSVTKWLVGSCGKGKSSS